MQSEERGIAAKLSVNLAVCFWRLCGEVRRVKYDTLIAVGAERWPRRWPGLMLAVQYSVWTFSS